MTLPVPIIPVGGGCYLVDTLSIVGSSVLVFQAKCPSLSSFVEMTLPVPIIPVGGGCYLVDTLSIVGSNVLVFQAKCPSLSSFVLIGSC